MMVRVLIAGIGLLGLSACGAQTAEVRPKPPSHIPPPNPVRAKPPVGQNQQGLDRIMGRDARSLVQLFGPFQLDIREEGARKLQFSNEMCVLDAYLYPPDKGKEPVVTYVSARVPDGRTADAASCVNALVKK